MGIKKTDFCGTVERQTIEHLVNTRGETTVTKVANLFRAQGIQTSPSAVYNIYSLV